MTKCYIHFPREICEGLIGTEDEVKTILKREKGFYSPEGLQTVRNREKHVNETVKVFSIYSGFICYKVS